ncbi:uncharacterized protein LOC120451365 isoform X2 [Drosophila santomea]|uniref:uncharacterized protein LOC120451365 isoform X2 n=1 Tax=Drosophila santomea TaxID=129105 RepID=UPI0019536C34|nr:uncharacterized protein LOC120451365 isoform X2 [Drosophila santomea]
MCFCAGVSERESVAKVATQLRQQQQCATTTLPPCCLPTPTRNSNNNAAAKEGEGTEDGRSEGGEEESEWISVGAATTKTFRGGRSIAPYQHTLIVSMGARE